MDQQSGLASTALLDPDQEPAALEVPTFLPSLEPWGHTFFRNLADTLLLRQPESVEITATPGSFWPDVFVTARLPWLQFAESGVAHALVFAALWGFSILWARRPQVLPDHPFNSSQVIYFSPSEYLPPLDTGNTESAPPQKGEPEYAKQPILSVPPEADNHSQTIVSPPDIHLDHDIATPNVVAWGDHSVPVPLAATARETPPLNSLTAPVVAPAPEVNRNDSRTLASLSSAVIAPAPNADVRQDRTLTSLTSSVVAPPPDAIAARMAPRFQAPQGSIVPPAPTVELAAQRSRDLTIGPSQIIAPAPQLAVPMQRVPAGLPDGGAAVIPPPPSLDKLASSAGGSGKRQNGRTPQGSAGSVVPPPPVAQAGAAVGNSGSGRLIALGIHPAPIAPPVAPGNRRGTFAAGPDGKAGAAGTPDIAASTAADTHGRRGAGKGTGKGSSDIPSGLNVGAPPGPAAASAGAHSGDMVNPALLANARLGAPSLPKARVASSSNAPSNELEHKVFGARPVYSTTLNMPNLNSAGGSWVIHFAELKDSGQQGAPTTPIATQKVDPAYPLELMRQNVAGTVTVRAVIGADGSVSNVEVVQGVDPRLDRYACEALRRWHFFPATRNGNPIDLEALVMIPFKPPAQKPNF